MSTKPVLADPALEALRKKYFPRIPWGERGPVRREYKTAPTVPGEDPAQVLADIAAGEGFTPPGERAVTGDGKACLAAFRRRAETGADTLIFGLEPEAVWCDLALGPPDGEGWRELLVRSEEAENLVALANSLGRLRFRRQ